MALRNQQESLLYKRFDFAGGLNTYASKIAIPDNASPDMQNFIVNKDGSISKRNGLTKLTTTANASNLKGVYVFGNAGVGGIILSVGNDGKVYGYDASSDSWDTLTSTAYLSTVGIKFTPVLISGNSNVIITSAGLYPSGGGIVKSTDTSANLLGGSPPDATTCEVYKGYVFLANDVTNPNRLWWSGAGLPESWDKNVDFVDVYKEDLDVIKNLIVINDQLYIYKRTKIYKFIFSVKPSDGRIVLVDDKVGLMNYPQQQISVGNNIISVGQSAIYLSSGNSFINITTPINDTFEDIGLHNALSVYNRKDNQCWFFLNDKIYIYDIQLNSWSYLNVSGASTMSGFDLERASLITNANLILAYGKNLYKYKKDNSIYTDNGTSFTAYWKTKYHNMGRPETEKVFYWLYLFTEGNAGDITVDYYLNWSTSATETITATTDSDGVVRIALNQARAKNISFKFTSTESTKAVKILGYEVVYSERGLWE